MENEGRKINKDLFIAAKILRVFSYIAIIINAHGAYVSFKKERFLASTVSVFVIALSVASIKMYNRHIKKGENDDGF